ncbi:acyltransferase [Pseudoalteromonas sp. NZS127]|uniref:acyltransferase family protein n=1 Tax=Pseudoalteromonas TaxID=53246 RepID=UPI0015CCA50D|nr:MULTISPECIES: acyltransferase [unclassified Pseudoalteromonas]MBH0072590.1 acyltransferase [Pseudoalteromonas sp. NZS127]MBH0092934.1 acyltransferase [Pseudoalteromonas sp. SCQQ13]NYR12244.1 acyltransferase [Pseudoalteromonas sp. MIP2626]|tara:strand:- start:3955 stop:4983 length:1029 start_codon:yes stop_codon:yes gene_type:complete
MKIKKILSLETLRGWACLLLVLNHLIGEPNISGLKLPENNDFYFFNLMLENVRMPLFAFLGGVIFSFRGVTSEQFFSMLKGKYFRLIIPLIFVGPIYLFIQAHTLGANQKIEITNITYYFSVIWESKFHFWFLQAMFLVFLFYGLSSFIKTTTQNKYIFALFTGIILCVFMPTEIYFFSLSGFFFLLPFFSLGCLLSSKRHSEEKLNIKLVTILLTLFAGLMLYKFLQLQSQSNFERNSLMGLVTGFVGCSLFYFAKIKIIPLVFIGKYSFSIYLYHVYFLVLSRMLLVYLGVQSTELNIVFGMFFGIFGPIAVEIVLSKSNYASRIFLGQKSTVKYAQKST